MKRALVMTLAAVAALLPAAPASAGGDDCSFSGPLEPGGELTIHCQIVNNASIDGTFYMFIPQETLIVRDASDNVVTGTQRTAYLNFFRMSLATQRVVTASTPTDGEGDDLDLVKVPAAPGPLPSTFRTECDEVPLTSLTGSTTNGFDGTHCYIGRVRRASALPPGSNVRAFDMTLHFIDNGTDMTPYIGYQLFFSYTIRARVPAANDCPGGCFVVYER